jgi:16S rRNA pseudouridine516 synthase
MYSTIIEESTFVHTPIIERCFFKLMRLDKFLTEHNIGSRSDVKKIIKSGHVTVNGQIVKASELKITETDQIAVDGKLITHQQFYYYMFHKPSDCVSACYDELHKTVMDYFKSCDRYKELFPVGRLDKDTEGLLIITNDGAFAHCLTSPHKHVTKQYYFESDTPLMPDAASRIKEGITLKDGMLCKPAVLELADANKGTLSITEGAYHQVKRMVAACGGHVTYLKRLSIGKLSLDSSLEKGMYRELTEEEKCLATCQ